MVHPFIERFVSRLSIISLSVLSLARERTRASDIFCYFLSFSEMSGHFQQHSIDLSNPRISLKFRERSANILADVEKFSLVRSTSNCERESEKGQDE